MDCAHGGEVTQRARTSGSNINTGWPSAAAVSPMNPTLAPMSTTVVELNGRRSSGIFEARLPRARGQVSARRPHKELGARGEVWVRWIQRATRGVCVGTRECQEGLGPASISWVRGSFVSRGWEDCQDFMAVVAESSGAHRKGC